jgi:glycosyltransferase involved in cell wall biosynthesis
MAILRRYIEKNVLKSTGFPVEQTSMTVQPRLTVLRIFGRYREYGGEEAAARRIHETLKPYMDAEWFESSTDAMLGDSLGQRLRAPFRAVHNERIAKELQRLQADKKFDAWEIHNVFPSLSPSVYATGIRLGVPLIQYLHNYRMSCVNGMFLNHGKPCFRCIDGNFFPAIQSVCWRDSRIACGFTGLALRRIRRLDIFRYVKAWIALSEAHKTLHVHMDIPEEKIHVVPHFFEIAENGVPAIREDGYALFLGRLSAEKGVAQLLEAWAYVKSPGARLVIAGKGPEEEKLRTFARDKGLSNVEFRGFVPAEAKTDLWAGARFLVAPSIWEEPFGLVVLEAWAHGRAVLASNRGSFPEMIDSGGLLCSPDSSTELAGAIQKMFESSDLVSNMAAAGQKHLWRNFGRKIWVNRIRSVYESCGLTGMAPE